jgi:hypothetical protein
MMVAALVSCAEGAHMGDIEPGTPPVGCDQELFAIQSAATAATSAAADQGIALLGASCDQSLRAEVAKVEKLLGGKKEEPPCTADELAVIPCSEDSAEASGASTTPKCVPPAPSLLALKAKAAGEKAQKISEKYQQAEADAKRSAEVTQVKKKKADLMKAVVVKAYQKAASEAAALATQKVGSASAMAKAVKVCEKNEQDNSNHDEAVKAQKEQEELITEQKLRVEASQASIDSKVLAYCQETAAIEASQALACEGNDLLEKIDSNLGK